MVKTVFGNKTEEEISKITLSKNTIERRIPHVLDNIEESVMAKLQRNLFALKIHEFTDISNHAQLIAFIRFIEEDSITNTFSCLKKVIHNYKRSKGS